MLIGASKKITWQTSYRRRKVEQKENTKPSCMLIHIRAVFDVKQFRNFLEHLLMISQNSQHGTKLS